MKAKCNSGLIYYYKEIDDMAKVIISVEDRSDNGVDISVGGDFEKDIDKCSLAQKFALEALAVMLRDVKGCSNSDRNSCSKECDGKG